MTEWVAFNASVIGTAHRRAGVPLQDESYIRVETSGSRQFAIGVVSDGAGSAARSDQGAQQAVQLVANRLTGELDNLHGVEEAVREVQAAFACVHQALSREDPSAAREFACTLLVLLASSEGWFVAGQIGDGAIVTSSGLGTGVMVEPVKGEFANQTIFITEPDSLSQLRIGVGHTELDWAALFTDGVENIAVDQASGEPHQRFFERFVESVHRLPHHVDDQHTEMLTQALERFLDSEEVNARVDDDKSLALMIGREAQFDSSEMPGDCTADLV